jgi:hypothetical protein
VVYNLIIAICGFLFLIVLANPNSLSLLVLKYDFLYIVEAIFKN